VNSYLGGAVTLSSAERRGLTRQKRKSARGGGAELSFLAERGEGKRRGKRELSLFFYHLRKRKGDRKKGGK